MTAGTEQQYPIAHTGWTIFEAYFDGANSLLKTNNVARDVAKNVGTGGRAGICIAGSDDHNTTYEGYLNLSFFAIYTNTLSSTERSNIYWYLGNKFNIPVTVP